MRPLALFAALLLTTTSLAADIRWENNYAKARKKAKTESRLLFLFFTAPS